MTLTFTSAQDAAIVEVLDWISTYQMHGKQVFRLFGYAGTGKTSIAKTIAERVQSNTGKPVVFAAFTGKAASVLRDKGCQATTIHRLIYKPKKRRCENCGAALADGKAHRMEAVQENGIVRNLCRGDVDVPPTGCDVDFVLAGGSMRTGLALVVIDECSMVGKKLGEDLLSFGVPVLVLGDPAQLPPVGDGGFFTNAEPDVLLTEIHRQKDGCGILDMATLVREGGTLRRGAYEESVGLPLSEMGSIDPLSFDQVLCGRNDTRAWWNKRMRARKGFTDPLPVPGDKLICLRNNYDVGLMNGEMVTAVEVDEVSPWDFRLTFVRDDGDEPETCRCTRHYFDGKPGNPEWGGSDVLVFDYGYAITTHKAQGSEWGRVLVHNEARVFRDDAARWLYTAITRAKKQVAVLGVS